MSKKKLQYCDCCKNIAFPERANRLYCRSCGRYIHTLVNKVNQKWYNKIRALKKKYKKENESYNYKI